MQNFYCFLTFAAWKMSVFGFFLFRIFPHSECGRIRTRKTPNTDNFNAVIFGWKKPFNYIFHQLETIFTLLLRNAFGLLFSFHSNVPFRKLNLKRMFPFYRHRIPSWILSKFQWHILNILMLKYYFFINVT